MKKLISAATSFSLSMFFAPAALSATCPYGGSPNWQGVCDTTTESGESYFGEPTEEINEDFSGEDVAEIPAEEETHQNFQPPVQNPNDSVRPPDQNIINQNPWLESNIYPDPSNPNIIPTSQDEPEIWAIVDEYGNTKNIIVCDIDFCGQGWIPTRFDGHTPIEWSRVILQSARNPETGDYIGGHWGTYDFSSQKWTERRGDSVYEIPVEYGSQPICIENCPLPEDAVLEDPIIEPEDPNISTYEQQSSKDIEAKSLSIKTKNKGESFSFVYKSDLRKKIIRGEVWVIAKNNKEKRVWRFKVNKNGRVLIDLPIKYLSWEIFVNYKLKNKYAKDKKRFTTKIKIGQ